MFCTIIERWKGKLSISSAIFLMLSAIIRVLAIGCFGLAFYVKYGGKDVIGDTEFVALDTIDLYGMPLATYIQGLVFGSITVFVTEAVCGIVGFIAGLKRKQIYLMGYICLCLGATLVYITHMVLWSILHAGVNDGSIKSSFDTYYDSYNSSRLKNNYDNIWRQYYAHYACCGNTGGSNSCTGCFDKFSLRMLSYIRTYLSLFCLCIVFQVANIIAADYTIIKLQLKENKEHISDQNKYILCLAEYGIVPTFWGFIKQSWQRSRMCLFSAVTISVNIISSVGLVIISIRFLSSDFVSTTQLLPLFRRLYIHGYSYHDIAAGFGSCVLAIGCLGIGTGIIGLIGSKLQSTILYTVSFFMTILILMLKIMAVVFWAVMYNEFVASNENNLYAYVVNKYSYSQDFIAINRLMINFRCCEFYDRRFDVFCYSDKPESVLDLYTVYAFNGSFSNKRCSTAVENSVTVFTGVFLAFMALGILLDTSGLVFISKDFKEAQTEHFANTRSGERIDGKYLIPWLLHIYNKEKRRNLYVVTYIIIAVFMLMLELSFIVLAAIFSLSYHVNRNYINAIGDVYKFLAISGIVLVSSSMIVRIVGLVGTFNKFGKTLFVSTAFMVLIALLNLAYIIMASVLRNDEYPCLYRDNTYPYNHDCSTELESTSGVAIGMFVIEFVSHLGLIILHDRSYQYFLTTDDDMSDGVIRTQEGIGRKLYKFLIIESRLIKNRPTLKILLTIYTVCSAIMLLLEISFVVLVSIHGLSWYLNRTWITDGLYNTYLSGVSLGLLFDFLAIGSLVLITIICANRNFGLAAVLYTKRNILLYFNMGVMIFTFLVTVIFIGLSSYLLDSIGWCWIRNTFSTCPHRKTVIGGVEVAMLILELLMQMFSFIVHDKCYAYFLPNSEESSQLVEIVENKQGMFSTLYDAIFRKRKPFRNAGRFTVCVVLYLIFSLFALMVEICFIVLVSIYGISYVLNRSWITLGLNNIYYSTMNLGVLFDFLSIGSLVLIPIISGNRFLWIIAVFTKRRILLFVNSIILFITLLTSIICVVLGSILLYAEYRCKYMSPTTFLTESCSEMRAIVGVGIAMYIFEILMQIVSCLVNDRSYQHFQDDADDSEKYGLLRTMINKTVLARKLIADFSQLKIPALVFCIGSALWLVVQILFWIGTIIEMGSPRLINDKLMAVLYTQSTDDINLGHLADGLSYTAMGFVPAICFVRVGGMLSMYNKRPAFIVASGVISILFGLGSVTLFGLSTYHMQYVYSCFGSTEQKCTGDLIDILWAAAGIFLAFFLVETFLHIFQSCLLFYAFKCLTDLKIKKIHLLQIPEKSKRQSSKNRIMKIANIVLRLLETLTAFSMMIAITFWLSGVHIRFNMSSLEDRSFSESNLLRLAYGLVGTSLVTITAVIINNIVGIVAVLTGKNKILIANTIVVGISILVELVSMGLQSVIENRIDDAAISVYISFTVVQVVIQVVYSALSIYDIKANLAHNKVNNNSFPLTNNRTTRNLVEGPITETNLD